MYGHDIIYEASSLVNLVEVAHIPLLIGMISKDVSQRVSLSSLRSSEYVNILKCGQFSNFTVLSKKNAFTNSRYQNDFEEIEFVGKGGFGEVVKAINIIGEFLILSINVLDGQHYAIKKIELKGNVKERDTILREVLTLSRMHNSNVVRYFTAWFQTISFHFDI